MKHLNNMACMLALLAAGSTGFTACSSDDAIDGGGNNTNGAAGKMVKTSFALNIPYGTKSARMTSEITQADGSNFRGMADMRMLAFNTDIANENKAIKKIVLGTSDQAFETDEYRRIYRDVTIPVGTKNFLFYGKTDGATVTSKFSVGSIIDTDELTKAAGASDVNDEIDLNQITFKLEQIQSGSFNENDQAKAVKDALEKVYATELNGTKWSACSTSSTDMVERHAATLFEQFKNMKAGSAASVNKVLDYLIKSCGGEFTGENPANMLEAIAKVAKTEQTSLSQNTFPNNLNLPDGAARGGFDNGTFTFANPAEVAMGSNGLDYTKVTYPAALNYYVQTEVAANDVSVGTLKTGSWPTYAEWKSDNYSWGTDWKNEVGTNTRTIALKKAIQYAVASLESTVRISNGVTQFTDNGKTAGKLLNNQTFSVGNGFELTGILVGGQPTVVGYDYTPLTATNVSYDYTVYDKEINGTNNVVGTNNSVTNYTLLLDNSNTDQQATKDVYVTIELVNNTGVDFYGADGLVPDGSKFYLVGTIEYEKGKYSSTGNSATTPSSVFAKDFKTKLNLNIGSTSLQKAYNTIPDLRSTQISLGLAVDLKWESGFTFNVDL